MEFMDVVYVVMWGLIAVYCFYSAHKLSPVLYLLGVFFVFMFAWYLINNLIPTDLFSGVYGIVFRCVALAFLIALIVIYIVIKKRQKDEK